MPLFTQNAWEVTERQISIAGLHPVYDGVRLVQLSDLHFYEYSDPNYYQAVAETVNKLNPDVLAVTGDVIHFGNRFIDHAGDFLSSLQAKEAKLAILGNHDYYDYAGGEAVSEMYARTGFQLLKNSACAMQRHLHKAGHGLWFVGLDDLWYGKPDIKEALSEVPADAPVIVLAHNPLLFDPVAYYPDRKVDLVVSGHTHAGHIYIPFLGPIYRKIFRMKYRYGLYQKNGCRLHVSSGLGSAAFYLKKQEIGFPRLRFNTQPEVSLLVLRAEVDR